MAISLTNIGTNSAKTADPTVTVTVGVGGVPSGCLICACVGMSDSTNSGVATVSDLHVATPVNTYISQTTVTAPCMVFAYAYNANALVQNDTISAACTTTSTGAAVSFFYVTGIQTGSDPYDTATEAGALAATVTMAAAPAVASSLVLAAVMQKRPSGDAFTQDSTNAAYGTPPNRVGTTGNPASGNITTAGGSVVSSSQLTYTPTFGASGSPEALIAAFGPASGSPTWFDLFGGFRDPRREPFRAVGGSPT